MADELEENYVLDSDGEYDDAEAGETVALEYDAQPTQGKRKRDDLSVETGAVTTGARRHDDPIDKPLTNTERNKRRRMAKKARKQERIQEEHMTNQENRLAVLPPDVQAEQVRGLIKRAFPKASSLELSEMDLPESYWAQVTNLWPQRPLEALPSVLSDLDPGLSLRSPGSQGGKDDAFERPTPSGLGASLGKGGSLWPTEPGEPYVLVVSMNANRCTDLARVLRPLLGPATGAGPGQQQGPPPLPGKARSPRDRQQGKFQNGKLVSATPNSQRGGPGAGRGDAEAERESEHGVIAKLFARHFKRSEQAALLRTKRTPLAVGTPGRLEQLLSPTEEQEPEQEPEQEQEPEPEPEQEQEQEPEQGGKGEGEMGRKTRPPLKVGSLRWIVLDVSWVNAKSFSLLDSPDTKQECFRLLAHPALRRRLGTQTKLVLF